MSVCETNELSSRRKSMDSMKLRNPHIIGITFLKEMKHRSDSKTNKKTMSQVLSSSSSSNYLTIASTVCKLLTHALSAAAHTSSGTEHTPSDAVLPSPELYLKRPWLLLRHTTKVWQGRPKTLATSDTTHRHTLK